MLLFYMQADAFTICRYVRSMHPGSSRPFGGRWYRSVNTEPSVLSTFLEVRLMKADQGFRGEQINVWVAVYK